jgi:hypothetical protein
LLLGDFDDFSRLIRRQIPQESTGWLGACILHHHTHSVLAYGIVAGESGVDDQEYQLSTTASSREALIWWKLASLTILTRNHAAIIRRV